MLLNKTGTGNLWGIHCKNVGEMMILSMKCQHLPHILPIPTYYLHKICKFAMKYQWLNISSSLSPLNINVFPTSTFPPQFINSTSAEVAKTITITYLPTRLGCGCRQLVGVRMCYTVYMYNINFNGKLMVWGPLSQTLGSFGNLGRQGN